MLMRKRPRHLRSYLRSKYSHQQPRYQASKWGSPHKRAIDRLALELRASEGLLCWFHSGVSWQALSEQITRGEQVNVEKERPVRAGGRRYIPDLTVRCATTGRILLLIEVWNTHAVSEAKRQAFAKAALPWIEVRASQVLSRLRSRPLPVLDWGGLDPTPPTQYCLFEVSVQSVQIATDPVEEILASWVQQLGSRFALSPRSGKNCPPRCPSSNPKRNTDQASP